jgi:serine/threonine-protein kinase
MSPELVMGEPVDHRADLFSLGVVLYNALTGTRLFYGPSDPATLHNVINEVIPPPSSVGLKPPPELDRVVMRALERDPDARFQTAANMIRELQTAALAYGLHNSRLDVGRWVSNTFAEELMARREAVRLIVGHTPTSEPVMGLLDDPTDICTPPTVESDFR